MNDNGLPPLSRALLAEAAAAPDGILSLTDDPRGEEAVDAAERLTDIGLLRIVTARRYRLSETGQAALQAMAGKRRSRPTPPQPDSAAPDTGAKASRPGLWQRLFGKKH